MRKAEFKAMIRLALPIVLAELGWMAMGVEDSMIVGRVGAGALGAVSLGAMVFYGVAICACGALLGLDTVVSQAFGGGDREDCRKSLVNGIWLASLLIPLVAGVVWTLDPLLAALGIDPAVLAKALPYLHALNWSTLPLLFYFALRRYLQAIQCVRPVMITLVTANLANLMGNWVLVFGHWGAPAMGAEGSGWATCLSRVYMAIAMILVIRKKEPGLASISWRPDFTRVRELLRLGLPAAGQIGVEVGVFAVVTILVAKLDAISLAAHQIAMTTVSTTYMMPLGIGSAAAVRVGHGLGRGDAAGAARSGWTAIGMGAAMMSAASILLVAAPQWIARLFTPDAQVIASAVTLLRIAAFFQLFDGLQSVATGALRGAGDTRTPMLCHFLGYWILGLPLGAVLCFSRGYGAAGLWTGLSAGLIVIGVILTALWRRTARRLVLP